MKVLRKDVTRQDGLGIEVKTAAEERLSTAKNCYSDVLDLAKKVGVKDENGSYISWKLEDGGWRMKDEGWRW